MMWQTASILYCICQICETSLQSSAIEPFFHLETSLTIDKKKGEIILGQEGKAKTT